MKHSQQRTLGICASCGTIHVEENGFEENRGCRDCGEWLVYSIMEYRDIAIDWLHLKEEYGHLMQEYNG